MDQANIGLGVLQEKKFARVVYAQESVGYRVVTSDAPRQHRGGVVIFYRYFLHFTV